MARATAEQDLRLIRDLAGGDARAWSDFIDRFSPVIYGAVTKTLRKHGREADEASDVAQDVFVRLCKAECRLLRQYDPAKAALSTWLTIIATSATIDYLRKLRGGQVGLEEVPEHVAAVDPVEQEKIKIPPGLLSDRQALVLQLLYDREMDVAEVATMLSIDAQTVRSTRHKALVKLRKHFGEELE